MYGGYQSCQLVAVACRVTKSLVTRQLCSSTYPPEFRGNDTDTDEKTLSHLAPSTTTSLLFTSEAETTECLRNPTFTWFVNSRRSQLMPWRHSTGPRSSRFPWSSLRHTAGFGESSPLIESDFWWATATQVHIISVNPALGSGQIVTLIKSSQSTCTGHATSNEPEMWLRRKLWFSDDCSYSQSCFK